MPHTETSFGIRAAAASLPVLSRIINVELDAKPLVTRAREIGRRVDDYLDRLEQQRSGTGPSKAAAHGMYM